MYRLQTSYDGVIYTAASGTMFWVAKNPNDATWLAYQAWLAQGNTAEPAPPATVVVPASVTRFQARAALQDAGMLDEVNAYFAALAEDDLHRLAWEEAPTVERDSDATLAAAAALGLTDTQMDQLFIKAATY